MCALGGDHSRRMAELALGSLMLLHGVTQSYHLPLTQQPESPGQAEDLGTEQLPTSPSYLLVHGYHKTTPIQPLTGNKGEHFRWTFFQAAGKVTWLPLQW